MSDTKLIVTKDKLDKLATSISNKSGVATPMTIAQMKAAVDGIAGGTITQDEDGYIVLSEGGDNTGGYGLSDIAINNYTGAVTLDNVTDTAIMPYTFAWSGITEIHAPYVTSLTDEDGIGIGTFRGCSNLTVVDMPNLIDYGSGGYQFAKCTSLQSIYLPYCGIGQHMFDSCSNLEVAVLGVAKQTGSGTNGNDFQYCSKLKAADMKVTRIHGACFWECAVFDTLILRNTSAASLTNINAFTNSPFASGKTGGTLYVPSALISSYQSATNWSTILGYENNQILPIEGSIYETQYADGTPISS